MEYTSRVTILVKASPQPSKSHQETVCCAGLTDGGDWKRLFPVRFRRLEGDKSFKRWDIVEFKYELPSSDTRVESCRLFEESIKITGRVTRKEEKSSLIERALVSSESEAAANNQSLAVIRPRNVNLQWQRLLPAELEEDKKKFAAQVAQLSFLEEQLPPYEPCPFKFIMTYEDGAGKKRKTCADWETSAAFFKLSRDKSEAEALEHLRYTYCEKYVKSGLVLALGNMKKRPQTWQLLGVFPVEEAVQRDLFT